MLYDVGEHHKDITVRSREVYDGAIIIPKSEILTAEHLVPNGVKYCVGTLAKSVVESPMEFEHPFIEMHSKMFLGRIFFLDTRREGREEGLGLFVVRRVEEEVHIAGGAPEWPLIALGNPLPLYEQGADALGLHFPEKRGDEIVHGHITPLDAHSLLKERQHLRLLHLPVLNMLEPRSDYPHNRLLISDLVDRLRVEHAGHQGLRARVGRRRPRRLILRQAHSSLPEPGPEQREEHLDIPFLTVHVGSKDTKVCLIPALCVSLYKANRDGHPH